MDAITIVGAGGIGCAIGYSLRATGVQVSFVDADEDKVRWGRAQGVRVEGRPAIAASFLPFAAWKPSTDEVILLCTKCYDNAAVLTKLPERAQLLPIQNGFDSLLESRGHVVEGIASFVSECDPGRSWTRVTRSGQLHIGYRVPAPDAEPLIRFLQAKLRKAPFRIRCVPEILPYKHTKLMYNAAISPLAAAAGLDNGELLRVPTARRLFFALIQENYKILASAGVRFGKIGPFHPATVQRILSWPGLARLFAKAFYPSLRGTYCSMSRDLGRGRTEVDNYTGYLLRLAGEGLSPLNQRVYGMLKRLERERRNGGPEILDQLLEPTPDAWDVRPAETQAGEIRGSRRPC